MQFVRWPTILAYHCVVSPALNALFDAVMTGCAGAGERTLEKQHRIAVVAVDVVDHSGRDHFSPILTTLAEGVCG
jgi:hypothetical protein